MKIIGLDEYRSLRGNGTLKYFELEGVPSEEWERIFAGHFVDQDVKVWIEGYCIVLQCQTDDIPKYRALLQTKCDETTAQLIPSGLIVR
jgi:hypothetical protein